MANDLVRSIERNRSIFTNLLKSLPSADREAHLARLADFYQERIDDVLAELDGAPSSIRTRTRGRVSNVLVIAKVDAPLSEPVPALTSVVEPEHVHDATCGHLREAVAKAEGATVPGAVRAVLASERDGLLPRQVIEGVKLLRPETDDESVHGALHQMWRRGEIAREGVHKHYRYRLVPLTSLGSGVVHMEGHGPGGATH